MANMDDEADGERMYIVLVNDEEQHSLWPSQKSIPAGWRAVREAGTKSECLKFVDEVWKDITPLSVRRQMTASS